MFFEKKMLIEHVLQMLNSSGMYSGQATGNNHTIKASCYRSHGRTTEAMHTRRAYVRPQEWPSIRPTLKIQISLLKHASKENQNACQPARIYFLPLPKSHP